MIGTADARRRDERVECGTDLDGSVLSGERAGEQGAAAIEGQLVVGTGDHLREAPCEVDR